MSAISILAMTMVIYLFGGYVDPPNERRLSTVVRNIRDMFVHKLEVIKERS